MPRWITAVQTRSPRASNLYAGTANPGRVYRYLGHSMWQAISPQLGACVSSLAEFSGRLYAGVLTAPFWGGASVGQVYRWDGGTTWTLVGTGMDNAVLTLATYAGSLHAGTGYNGGGYPHASLYACPPSGAFAKVAQANRSYLDLFFWEGFRAMYAWPGDGLLHLGSVAAEGFGAYDGAFSNVPYYVGPTEDLEVQVTDIRSVGGAPVATCNPLYPGDRDPWVWVARPQLWVYSGGAWSILYDYPEYNYYFWQLCQHRGGAYYCGGAINSTSGRVWDFNGNTIWSGEDAAISLATDGVTLYIGTGLEGTWLYRPGIGGFWPQPDCRGHVYAWDGSTAGAISGELGQGVQCLCVASVQG